jgi:hypothetical protein
MIWAGRILTAVTGLFLLFDGAMKVVRPPFIVQANVQLGYPERVISGIGFALLACTTVYLVPRTSVLGAVLLTAYLGGAVATQVRVGASLFETVFPIMIALLMWAGLFLRDQRLWSLISAAA